MSHSDACFDRRPLCGRAVIVFKVTESNLANPSRINRLLAVRGGEMHLDPVQQDIVKRMRTAGACAGALWPPPRSRAVRPHSGT